MADTERWAAGAGEIQQDGGDERGGSDTSAPVYARVGQVQERYRLPRAEEVRRWQSERDALEEEVLRFDGGDLGRMKEKTRGE